jgi:hypothetical protein
MSCGVNSNICYSFNIINDRSFYDNTDTSYNIYGLNSSSITSKKNIKTQLKCADLKKMTQVQKYVYEAKGYLYNN